MTVGSFDSLDVDYDYDQRNNLFYTKCFVKEKWCALKIDSGCSSNLVSIEMVTKLGLNTFAHPKPYELFGLNSDDFVRVSEQVWVEFELGPYKDKILFDVVGMDDCHVVFGRPWIFDLDVIQYGRSNEYRFKFGLKTIVLKPMSPQEIRTMYATSQTVKPIVRDLDSNPEIGETEVGAVLDCLNNVEFDNMQPICDELSDDSPVETSLDTNIDLCIGKKCDIVAGCASLSGGNELTKAAEHDIDLKEKAGGIPTLLLFKTGNENVLSDFYKVVNVLDISRKVLDHITIFRTREVQVNCVFGELAELGGFREYSTFPIARLEVQSFPVFTHFHWLSKLSMVVRVKHTRDGNNRNRIWKLGVFGSILFEALKYRFRKFRVSVRMVHRKGLKWKFGIWCEITIRVLFILVGCFCRGYYDFVVAYDSGLSLMDMGSNVVNLQPTLVVVFVGIDTLKLSFKWFVGTFFSYCADYTLMCAMNKLPGIHIEEFSKIQDRYVMTIERVTWVVPSMFLSFNTCRLFWKCVVFVDGKYDRLGLCDPFVDDLCVSTTFSIMAGSNLVRGDVYEMRKPEQVLVITAWTLALPGFVDPFVTLEWVTRGKVNVDTHGPYQKMGRWFILNFGQLEMWSFPRLVGGNDTCGNMELVLLEIYNYGWLFGMLIMSLNIINVTYLLFCTSYSCVHRFRMDGNMIRWRNGTLLNEWWLLTRYDIGSVWVMAWFQANLGFDPLTRSGHSREGPSHFGQPETYYEWWIAWTRKQWVELVLKHVFVAAGLERRSPLNKRRFFASVLNDFEVLY